MTEKQVDKELERILNDLGKNIISKTIEFCDGLITSHDVKAQNNTSIRLATSQLKPLMKEKAKECNPTKTQLIEYVRSNLIERVQELFNRNIDQKFK